MAKPGSGQCLLDCHEDIGGGVDGEGDGGMETLGWNLGLQCPFVSYLLIKPSHLGVRIIEEAPSSRRPSATPSRSSMLKKSFRYRPNRRSTVIHFKQTFRSFKGKLD